MSSETEETEDMPKYRLVLKRIKVRQPPTEEQRAMARARKSKAILNGHTPRKQRPEAKAEREAVQRQLEGRLGISLDEVNNLLLVKNDEEAEI